MIGGGLHGSMFEQIFAGFRQLYPIELGTPALLHLNGRIPIAENVGLAASGRSLRNSTHWLANLCS